MPPILGNLIALAVVLLIVGFAIRSMWKKHKNGGGCCGCDGCSGSCGCGCGCGDTEPKK